MTRTDIEVGDRDSFVDEGGLTATFVNMSDEEAAVVLERLYGARGDLIRVATEKDDTFLVDLDTGTPAVLKVANPSEPLEEIDFQTKLMAHVARRDPTLPVPAVIDDVHGEPIPRIVDLAGQSRAVRLLTRLPGTPLDRTGSTAAEREKIGVALARLRIASADFAHPGDSRLLAWDVRHATRLSTLLDHIGDRHHRQQLSEGLTRISLLQPRIDALRTQVLHNDFSKSNIIVDHEDPEFVTGIIDFGDAVRTAVAVDVSTALLNQLPSDVADHPVGDLFAAGRDVLRGYLSVAELTDEELRLLPHLVMARVVARALITHWRAKLFPANVTYIMRNTEQGWAQLDWLLSRSIDELSGIFLDRTAASSPNGHPRKDTPMAGPPRGKMNNAFDPSQTRDLDAQTRSMVERRSDLLGPAYRLFYRNPVEISRGKGTVLYDRHGNEYLDAYNNVVSVGHAHPRVVAAVHEQMQTLCTHTRYLQDGILEYAAALRATFDGPLGQRGHTMFTCTGSEANDLALRIARHHTGRTGVIVTAEAYHGNSHLTAGFSPSLGRHSPLGPTVRTVIAPDSYRIDPARLVEEFTADVARQIDDLERHGDGLAAFVVDSLFSSDGIYAEPTDLLAPVVELVHKAGGLFVADEVQSGFARSGDQFWGYQRHGIAPDIVSMGKPMGNGFPVAGVAVLDEVVTQFGNDMRYFNTFGGNTVAMAAAQATLDVIIDEELQKNAHTVGTQIRDGLAELAQRHSRIGDVRGAGLYVGVELVDDAESMVPDGPAATAVVNEMRERRVLISSTGPHGNVLKIRPPLVFSGADADRLLTELDAVLSAM